MFLTEIKNVGKPDVEIDVKYSERDRTVRYGLLAISSLSYTEKHLIEKIIYMEIVHFSVYLFSIDILKFSKRIDVYWILLYSLFYSIL
jgi:hypothetical protein